MVMKDVSLMFNMIYICMVSDIMNLWIGLRVLVFLKWFIILLYGYL